MTSHAQARTGARVGTSSDRWLAIDASRGVAMAFVCLSHFGTGYFAGIGHPERQELTDRISMLASPAFMLISGSMLGLLSATRTRERFARVREKLIDRGLFLILIAHALIVIAHIPLRDGPRAWMRWGFITDTIGFCLVAGPYVVRGVSPRARLCLAGALYVVGWLIVCTWQPTALAARVVKDSIFGPMGTSTRLYNFPLAPWLALYLAGSVLGEAMVARRARGQSPASLLARVGGAAALIALACVIAERALGVVLTATAGDIFAHMVDLASPFQKLPPAPIYFLGYGGLALLLTAALVWAEDHRLALRTLGAAALVGRASLFVFVLQYYVNFVIVPQLGLPETPWWPLFFLASLAGIFALAALWMRAGLNRLITVGFRFPPARSRSALDATATA